MLIDDTLILVTVKLCGVVGTRYSTLDVSMINNNCVRMGVAIGQRSTLEGIHVQLFALPSH